jgi:hypothetical protein
VIDLSDVRWSRLRHAFGPADDIPDLLVQLAEMKPLPTNAKEEPLASLWESICHQACPDNAAYAAVPHLVQIAADNAPRQRAAVLHLVGSITAFAEYGALCPDYLKLSFEYALMRCFFIATETLESLGPKADDSRMVLSLLADVAAVGGLPRLGRALQILEMGEIEVECVGCGGRQWLGMGDNGLEIDPLEWIKRPPTAKTETSPFALPTLADIGERPSASLLSGVASALDLPGLSRCIADLAGSIKCPDCKSSIQLVEGANKANWGS